MDHITPERVRELLKGKSYISLYKKINDVYHSQDYDGVAMGNTGWCVTSPYQDYKGQPKRLVNIKMIYENKPPPPPDPITLFDEMSEYCDRTTYPEHVVVLWMEKYKSQLESISYIKPVEQDDHQ